MLDMPVDINDLRTELMQGIHLNQVQKVGSPAFFQDGSLTDLVGDHWARDLNGDGIDEIIMGGLESASAATRYENDTFSKSKVHIYAWVNGKLIKQTRQWLPNGINNVEGVSDMQFGDFNGDGLLDIYWAASSDDRDTEFDLHTYQLINQGDHFVRTSMGVSLEEHGSAVGDLNDDGYDDIVVSTYTDTGYVLMGGQDGLTRYPMPNFTLNGSDIEMGDFMGDGTKTIIVTDHLSHEDDTHLKRILFDRRGRPSDVQEIGALPKPILETQKYKDKGVTSSHDIRALNFDFNYDGLDDVLILSRAWLDAQGRWPDITTLQFLENQGGGQFTDVTDDILLNWRDESAIGYNPVIADFNRDGIKDIFLSAASFGGRGTHDSTRIIFGTESGHFFDGSRGKFNQLLNDHPSAFGTMARGPGGQHYFISKKENYNSPFTDIYSTKFNTKSPYIGFKPVNKSEERTVFEEGTGANHRNFFVLESNEPVKEDIWISFKTVEGTAKAEQDFVPKGGQRFIKAGTTRIIVGVDIIADSKPEEYEKTFSMELYYNGNKFASFEHTILDDD